MREVEVGQGALVNDLPRMLSQAHGLALRFIYPFIYYVRLSVEVTVQSLIKALLTNSG